MFEPVDSCIYTVVFVEQNTQARNSLEYIKCNFSATGAKHHHKQPPPSHYSWFCLNGDLEKQVMA